ncbi:hypothetical protein [Natroniella sp. ANB-PHB2]|uniref:hypothetical protein n=1 Tax=Natroniella sp. ANB-PHB2 TaxID=3384444 RepID=UPI0038D371B3
MKKKLVIFLITLHLVLVISHFTLANSNLEREIEYILENYKQALNEEDIELIKELGTEKFFYETDNFLTEVDSIYIEFFRLEDYDIIEEKNEIEVMVWQNSISRKNNSRTKVNRPFYLILEEINGNYYIKETNLYEELSVGEFPFIPFLIGLLIVIIYFWKKAGVKKY